MAKKKSAKTKPYRPSKQTMTIAEIKTVRKMAKDLRLDLKRVEKKLDIMMWHVPWAPHDRPEE
jgi:hypothetical protein